MTTVLILMYGAGAILIISGTTIDPNTGQTPSIVDTLREIWNGKAGGTAPAGQPGDGGGTGPIPPKGRGTGQPDYNAQHWLAQRYGQLG